MTQSPETALPPIHKGSRVRGTIRLLFRKVTPFSELIEIQKKFLQLFRTLYHNFPVVNKSFSQWDNPTLVQEAGEARDNARNYNPHREIEDIVGFFKFIQIIFLTIFALLTVISFLLGFSLFPVFRELFSSVGAPLSFMPTIVVVFGWLYLGLLRWNRDALQVFNEELSIPKNQIKRNSRRKPELVSYYIWNRVLQGQKIPTIVCGFYLFNQIANMPLLRRYFDDPTEFFVIEIANHYDVLSDSDGYLDAIREIYRRKRNSK